MILNVQGWKCHLSRMGFARCLPLLLFVLFLTFQPSAAQSPIGPSGPDAPSQPVVRLVLFWMESCGHCHDLIDRVLPALQEQYGDQLHIELVELKGLDEIDFLYSLAEVYSVPREDIKVPALLVGSTILIGVDQISSQLPLLIDQYLAEGGAGYPDVEGLSAVLNFGDDGCQINRPCTEAEAASAVAPPAVSAPADAALAVAAPAIAAASPTPGPVTDYSTLITAAMGLGGVLMVAAAVIIRIQRGRRRL
jgi:hypothetical protein